MKNQNGFTLVELLVVLVILAVLAAAIIPSTMGFIDKSKAGICQTNCQTGIRLSKANIYADMISDINIRNDNDKQITSYENYLNNYIATNKLCPSGGTVKVDIKAISSKSIVTIAPGLICSKHGDVTYEFDVNEPKEASFGFYGIMETFVASAGKENLFDTNAQGNLKNDILGIGNNLKNGTKIVDYINSIIDSQSFKTFSGQAADARAYLDKETKELKSVSFKYGSVAYITFANGNIYALGNGIYRGDNGKNVMRDESYLLEKFAENEYRGDNKLLDDQWKKIN